ncbi:MAG TPA: ABC transporter permease [Thermoanaerobaculia bacterium]
MFHDLKYALRILAKSPGFTLIAVVTLALGLGANTALYGWVRSLLLAPLPGVARPGRVVAIETRTPDRARIDSSWADYTDLRDQASSFDGLIAFQQRHVSLHEKDSVRRLFALFVSGNYFDVLGVRPALGRTFLPEEGRVPGGHPVAVIGFGFWGSHFGFDPQVVGKVLRINERELTVVGVASPQFKGTINGLNTEVYIPLALNPLIGGEVGGDRARLEGNRTNRWLDIMGRLKPGADLRQAQAELDTLAAGLAKAFPDSNQGLSFIVEPVTKATYGSSAALSGVVLALFAAVGLVLLIACSNVANLLLVRATVRRREIAVRLALGASRARLVRLLVTESAVLSLLGAAAGLLIVPAVNGLLAGIVPNSAAMPIDLQPPLDARVFVFGFALALATGILFGLAPALQSSHPDVEQALRDGTPGGGSARQGLRRVLVVAQVALAVVLLAATGLFTKSLQNARKIDPGFDPSHVLLTGFDFPQSLDRKHVVPFFRDLLARTSAIPGVVAASYGNHVPLWLEGGDWEEIRVDGYTPGPNENMKIDLTLTWPGYFSVMKMPLVEGRDFTERDDAERAPVAIVNQTFASRYLAGKAAVGSRIWINDKDTLVVGVVRNARYRRLTEEPRPFLYAPQLQWLPPGTALHVRLSPDASEAAVAARIREEVAAIDPRVATVSASLEEVTSTAVIPQRLGAKLFGAVGALALLIASIGVYGLMAYSVSRRRREIGVRMALGAQASQVGRLVLKEGVTLAALGLGMGLLAALAVARLVRSLLVEVSPADPMIFAAVILLLGGAALLACWLPARRAARLNPVEALRSE